jgi:hypothetical protein
VMVVRGDPISAELGVTEVMVGTDGSGSPPVESVQAAAAATQSRPTERKNQRGARGMVVGDGCQGLRARNVNR